MNGAMVEVVVLGVIVSVALVAGLLWWTWRVSIPRDKARWRGTADETSRYAAAQGWQAWQRLAGDTSDGPWSGLLAQLRRGGAAGSGVMMAVEGSRSGHCVYGLWTMERSAEGAGYPGTTCGLLLPRGYQGELSVRPRRPRPLTRRAQGGGELTGDAEFGRRFHVRWRPGGAGPTASELLTTRLRSALLSGDACQEWRLSGRTSARAPGWLPGAEFDALVTALIMVIDCLPVFPDVVAAASGGPSDRGADGSDQARTG